MLVHFTYESERKLLVLIVRDKNVTQYQEAQENLSSFHFLPAFAQVFRPFRYVFHLDVTAVGRPCMGARRGRPC